MCWESSGNGLAGYRLAIHADTIATAFLGAVQRLVGSQQQGLRAVVAIAGRDAGNAEAGGDIAMA